MNGYFHHVWACACTCRCFSSVRGHQVKGIIITKCNSLALVLKLHIGWTGDGRHSGSSQQVKMASRGISCSRGPRGSSPSSRHGAHVGTRRSHALSRCVSSCRRVSSNCTPRVPRAVACTDAAAEAAMGSPMGETELQWALYARCQAKKSENLRQLRRRGPVSQSAGRRAFMAGCLFCLSAAAVLPTKQA